MKSNTGVCRAWLDGRKARNRSMSTDGFEIFSYALKIGETLENGRKIVYDYTSTGMYYSRTTSCHVSTALNSRTPGSDEEDLCYYLGYCNCKREGCCSKEVRSLCFKDFGICLGFDEDMKYIVPDPSSPMPQLGPGGVELYRFIKRINYLNWPILLDPKFKDEPMKFKRMRS